MKAKLSDPIWHGTCVACEKSITFNPKKPMIQNENEYTCICGKRYWIDRDTGFYQALGTENIKLYKNFKICLEKNIP